MKYNVEVEVPHLDGVPHCSGCSMLLITRFGTEHLCRLYTEEFGGRHPTYLRYYDDDPHKPIEPHEKCLDVLRKHEECLDASRRYDYGPNVIVDE